VAALASLASLASAQFFPLNLASAATLHPFAATWLLHEPPGAQVAVDSSGYGHNGTIEPGVQPTGREFYHFVGTGRVVVPMDWAGGLDPYTRDASISLTFRTTSTAGMNVIQKGQSGSPNGWWKVEVNQGHVACTFRGSEGVNGVWLTRFVADGRWHTITCARKGDVVSLAIDYDTTNWQVNAVDRATGNIHNSKPLTIGGKVACQSLGTGCDNFNGDLANIRLW
jgi:hypothetical protein